MRRVLQFLAVAGVAGAVLVPAGAVVAQQYPSPTNTPSVTTDPGAKTGSTTANPSGSSSNTGAKGTLPFTGGDIAGLAAVGLGAAGVGVVLVRSGRRRRRVEV